MTTIAIVQARMNSSRLPNKVMKLIDGTPMIGLLLKRLSKSKELNRILVATSNSVENKILVDYVLSLGFDCYIGSEDDVLERYVLAAKKYNAEAVVRITGDCPLIDPDIVDECVSKFRKLDVDYLSNVVPPTYPDGLDVEVFKSDALRISHEKTRSSYDREHVTPFIRDSGLFSMAGVSSALDFSGLRWTVDELPDFIFVSKVFEHFSPRSDFSWKEVLDFVGKNPEVGSINSNISRNQGAVLSKGQKLWKHAKTVIPGGNMLLSKRSEMFLPDQWPSYYSRAKGCKVWDLDGREFIDMSTMGVGTNVLGYCNEEVDQAVIEAIRSSNMSTLNCPEEVFLADRLISMHPWAEMVRFARTGGEANALAIRIARAASGKDQVAICGYHGWHDWYLAANLNSVKSLDGHLLPGLEVNGVPRNLTGTIFPFDYNDYDGLEKIVSANNIGVIKMEVSRSEGPQEHFLEKVRKLATKIGAVLVFDECTSGFRETFGGLHKKYGVEPDMAVFGKALGNGYAITAIIGRREVMEAAQTTFISSTFWTEKIGPTAALKTLDVMERELSWDRVTKLGESLFAGWNELAKKFDLQISFNGLPALAGFSIKSKDFLAYKTLICQEMLASGYLAGSNVYTCIAHTPEIIKEYMEALEKVFILIRECEDGRDIHSLLKGPVCHGGFKRLN